MGLTVIKDTLDLSKFEQIPDEAMYVRPMDSWCDAVLDRFANGASYRGKPMPWAQEYLGVRPGEVSIWGGYNGSGKSLLTGQMMLGLAKASERALIASLEMPPAITSYRMARQALGELPPFEDTVREFFAWTHGRLWLFEQTSTVHWKRIIALARYCAAELKITQFVVDSLMKCGILKDDFNTQVQMVDQLCAVAKDTGMHIHLVAHMRKSDGEHYQSDKMDIRGAGEITDLVDNVYTLWRNKPKEREAEKSNPDTGIMNEPDALLSCSKNRHGEWEGRVRLWYHDKPMVYLDKAEALPHEWNYQAREG